MYWPDGRGHTVTTGGEQGPRTGGSMYLISEALAHWIAYGSLQKLMVDYWYGCSVGRGICYGRDLVGPDLWSRLSVGKTVNVRQGEDETVTARLDQNPQLTLALVQIGIAALFLTTAGWVSGRLKLPTLRHEYVSVDAIVTAVEEVKYRDVSRWRVRFAYFDGNGNAQESADEVTEPIWHPGDACAAVYRREAPDLATLAGARA